MRKLATIAAIGIALGLTAPAGATSFQLRIEPGQGPMLRGPGGLHAIDIKTADTLLRVIAPGNRIEKRGTLRVLVMNLGKPAYEFGPDEVAIEMSDGTPLQEVPVDVFEQGQRLVSRESSRSAAIDRSVRASLSSVAQSANGGMTAQTIQGHQAGASDVRGESLQHNDPTEVSKLPGVALLDKLNGVLRPLSVGPKQAWGGYLVFDMPKAFRRTSAGQPVTIVVRTGNDVHRIKAVLSPL